MTRPARRTTSHDRVLEEVVPSAPETRAAFRDSTLPAWIRDLLATRIDVSLRQAEVGRRVLSIRAQIEGDTIASLREWTRFQDTHPIAARDVIELYDAVRERRPVADTPGRGSPLAVEAAPLRSSASVPRVTPSRPAPEARSSGPASTRRPRAPRASRNASRDRARSGWGAGIGAILLIIVVKLVVQALLR